MVSIKQQVRQMLDDLPEDCSVEDVQYHLFVIEKIRRRLDVAKTASFVPQNDVERQLAKWLDR